VYLQMRVEIEVPAYAQSRGLQLVWDDDFEIAAIPIDGAVHIKCNAPGLRSLARQLLLLAQDAVPSGHHIHLDENAPLEPGSIGLILEKS
jgi:hypothetical protein